RRRHTRFSRDWSSDVCSSDLTAVGAEWTAQALCVPVQRKQFCPLAAAVAGRQGKCRGRNTRRLPQRHYSQYNARKRDGRRVEVQPEKADQKGGDHVGCVPGAAQLFAEGQALNVLFFFLWSAAARQLTRKWSYFALRI